MLWEFAWSDRNPTKISVWTVCILANVVTQDVGEFTELRWSSGGVIIQ
jgi:hypothetical protein